MIAIYCRVSSRGQVKDDKVSLDEQERLGIAYAGDRTYKVYRDIWTGTDITREGFQNLLNDIQHDLIDTVWIYKVNRWSRDTVDGLSSIKLMRQKGTKLVVNGVERPLDTSTTKLLIGIEMLMAELDRDDIVERLRTAQKINKDNGNRILAECYGYNSSYSPITGKRELIINEVEAKTVIEIYDLFLQGLNLNQIAQKLNQKNIPTKKQGKVIKTVRSRDKPTLIDTGWTSQQVKKILRRPEYAGKTWNFDKTQLIDAKKVKGFLDSEKWEKVQKSIDGILKERNHNRRRNHYYLLSSIITCEYCGMRFSSHNGKSSYYYYTHEFGIKDRKRCVEQKPKNLNAKDLERIFEILFYITFLNPNEFSEMALSMRKDIQDQNKEIYNINNMLHSKLEKQDQIISNLVKLATLQGEEIEEISKQLSEARKIKNDIKQQIILNDNKLRIIEEEMDSILDVFKEDTLLEFIHKDIQGKNRILQDIIKQGIIKDSVLTLELRNGKTYIIEIPPTTRGFQKQKFYNITVMYKGLEQFKMVYDTLKNDYNIMPNMETRLSKGLTLSYQKQLEELKQKIVELKEVEIV